MPTIKEPRSPVEQVAGVSWLARMIDKARLEAEGSIEQLDLEYPCPMDQNLLRQLEMTSQDFQQIVISSKTDDEIVEKLRQAGVKI